MERQSLAEYLDSFLRRQSDIAYVQRRGYRMQRWSYGAVARSAFQFARELESRQIGSGGKVLLWGENCAEWVIAFFGCLLRGAVAVPMDRIASPEFVLRVYREVNASLLLCSRHLAPAAASLPVMALESLPQEVARHSPAPYQAAGRKRADTVEIVFTSGATSEPKGVIITHGNILSNLAPFESEIPKYLKYERWFHPLRFLNLVPLSHVFGQFMGIFVPQLLGATVLFQETLNPSDILRTLQRERVSALMAVPRILDALKNKIERDLEAAGRATRFQAEFEKSAGRHFLLRWWRFRQIHRRLGWKFWAFISGGAALYPGTEEFWRRLGFVVIQGYGLTETASLISVNHPFRVSSLSIGKVLPGREIKLDEQGEILVRGESIASGYLQRDESKPVTGEGGWFHTGDVGALDQQGKLYFKGRQKNVIVTPEGMKVYPQDLERALRQQPEVLDCVIVRLARNGNAEACAVLLLRSPESSGEAAVRRANQLLAGYQQVRRWLVWPNPDFPRTATQKPRLDVIEEKVRSQLEGHPELPATSGSLARLIARVSGALPAKHLSANAKLDDDLNLSSLDRVELMSVIEDEYQIDLDENAFAEAATVSELEQLLRAPAAVEAAFPFPRWAQRWPVTWARVAAYYLVIWPVTMLLARPKIIGRENLRPLAGPALFICNHVTSVDIAFALAALPARLRRRLAVAMSGELLLAMRRPAAQLNFLRRGLERLKYGLVVGLFNVFPLPQYSGFRQSFEYAGESADRGYNILVFPEGRRSSDGRLQPFRSGIGLLALRLQLPVVAIRIDGLFELKQARRRTARPEAVHVVLGAPVCWAAEQSPEEITRELQSLMESLSG